MEDNETFVKTPKGVEEMTSRSLGLGQRARRLLILVDGKKELAGIAAAFPGEDARGVLKNLASEGFIRLLEPPAPPPEPKRPAAAPAPSPLDDAQRFDMARNFMVNTVNAFLGIMGSNLIEKLERCRGLEELRSHYAAWREAIQMSREGRGQAADLESRLAALLS